MKTPRDAKWNVWFFGGGKPKTVQACKARSAGSARLAPKSQVERPRWKSPCARWASISEEENEQGMLATEVSGWTKKIEQSNLTKTFKNITNSAFLIIFWNLQFGLITGFHPQPRGHPSSGRRRGAAGGTGAADGDDAHRGIASLGDRLGAAQASGTRGAKGDGLEMFEKH